MLKILSAAGVEFESAKYVQSGVPIASDHFQLGKCSGRHIGTLALFYELHYWREIVVEIR
jgi:hypothetical protein